MRAYRAFFLRGEIVSYFIGRVTGKSSRTVNDNIEFNKAERATLSRVNNASNYEIDSNRKSASANLIRNKEKR